MINENKIDPSAFLAGKYIYLRPPDIEKDIRKGNWYTWFNDKKVTRFLNQGVFPNTLEKQIEFVESLKNNQTRVVLCIIDKVSDKHIGVVSLYNIDFINRRADISLVIGEKKYSSGAPLEAMALMTEYGFDRLNLNKIDAGQVINLWIWVNALELIGYKIEGYFKSVFIRDGNTYDSVHTGITSGEFYKLRKERNGDLCCGDVVSLLHKRRKENIIEKVKKFFDGFYQG